MIDFVQQFVAFLLGASVTYVVIQIILNYFAIRFMKIKVDQYVESRAIPITVEVDNDRYYCYNKQSKEFMAQGTTYDEVKTALESRFGEYIYILKITKTSQMVIQKQFTNF